jgi:hypothetical protein
MLIIFVLLRQYCALHPVSLPAPYNILLLCKYVGCLSVAHISVHALPSKQAVLTSANITVFTSINYMPGNARHVTTFINTSTTILSHLKISQMSSLLTHSHISMISDFMHCISSPNVTSEKLLKYIHSSLSVVF